MSVSLLLGAGFSKWGADLPVASELFDFKIESWKRETRRLEIVKTLKRQWDCENPDDLTEKFIAQALMFPPNNREAVLWYIARRLTEPFIFVRGHSQRRRRHIPMINDTHLLGSQGIKNIERVRWFLQPFCGFCLDGIITTNYDLLIEYALGSKLFNYGKSNQWLKGYKGRLGISSWVLLKGHLPLAKIHGSISRDEDDYYADGRCGLTGKALIVAPSPDKKPQEVLKYEWELADNILKKSKHLAVFGFAFNPYDTAVLDLLKNAGQNLKTILLIDIHPPVKRVHNLLPNTTIIPCAPPPDGNLKIRNWLQDILN
jgi:hypothetical protein